MTPRLVKVEVQQYKKMQSHALQCGVLTRSSRLLLNCRTHDDLAETLVSCFGALSLSGWLRIDVAGGQSSRCFGEPASLEAIEALRPHGESQQIKVEQDTKQVVFRTPHFAMLGWQQGTFVPVVGLQENLSVFVDTVETWLAKYEADLEHKRALEQETRRSTEQLELLGQRLGELNSGLQMVIRQVSQELISRLMAQFPTLALQADQEEAILETVSGALLAQGRLVESQREQLTQMTHALALAARQSLDSMKELRRSDTDLAFKRVVGASHRGAGYQR